MNAENFLSGILQNTEACRRILSHMVQWGTVTAVDDNTKKARVYFEDTGISSDWLAVLQQAQSDWVPQIDDAVLVLFLPVAHADGFILGVIPWTGGNSFERKKFSDWQRTGDWRGNISRRCGKRSVWQNWLSGRDSFPGFAFRRADSQQCVLGRQCALCDTSTPFDQRAN